LFVEEEHRIPARKAPIETEHHNRRRQAPSPTAQTPLAEEVGADASSSVWRLVGSTIGFWVAVVAIAWMVIELS
jgi:hypothetical protein